MKELLQKEITVTFDNLHQVLLAFNEQQLNLVPFEGSWTAGQVTEHIIKGLSGLSPTVNGPVEITQRKPGEKIKPIEDMFLDFTTKLKSPGFLIPTGSGYQKEELLTTLDNLKHTATNAAETLDLKMTCLASELPAFGTLTRFEWIRFFLIHTQRHTHQIENIYRHIITNK
jgi:hypothetical protein